MSWFHLRKKRTQILLLLFRVVREALLVSMVVVWVSLRGSLRIRSFFTFFVFVQDRLRLVESCLNLFAAVLRSTWTTLTN